MVVKIKHSNTFVIAMRGPLGDGLLRRLVDAHVRVAPTEAAHTCSLSDPYAGYDAADAWEAIGFIAAAGRACFPHHHCSSSSFGVISHVEVRRNKYR